MVDAAQAQPRPRALKTVIVGGGAGCEAFLRILQHGRLGEFDLDIQGVADVNTSAPGARFARSIGVPIVSTDYRELLRVPDLDLIIELTGTDEVRDLLERERPRGVRLVDHFGARLFWELHQAHEELNSQREQVEQERARIAQVFDSIPDEVVVLDADMVIQHANASFLRNNEVTLDDVKGKHCYEVDQRVRGECQVALANCPCATALQDGKTSSVVRKHFDPEGNARYAAIVAGPISDRSGTVTGAIEMTRDITHRIGLEEELKATEVRLRQFMETAPLATSMKNRQGQYIEVNPAACELLGLPKAEILGRTDLEILPREAAEVLRQGDGEVVRSLRQHSYDVDVTLAGKRVFLSTTKYPVVDAHGRAEAVVALSKDVTLQKEIEAALTRTREYLQNILDNAPMIIITTDLEGRIASLNKEAERALGYAATTVIGQPAGRLYPQPEELDALLRRIREDGSVHDHETILLTKEGREVPVSETLSQLKDVRGEMIGTVAMSRDISRRRALMDQIIQSERLAAVGRLAAGVAHEINNPLAVIAEIAGFINDLVADLPGSYPDPLEEELKVGLPKILSHVRRGRSITSRLLSFARKTEACAEIADVNKAIEEILPFLAKQAKLANITIHRSLQPDLPQIQIEELQLEEVLINLITNAIQAMADRGHGNVWLESETRDSKVVITVRDDGPGIDDAVRSRLFDPFVSTKALGHGTGLGLSICYGIVKRYDGEIRVHSTPGQGATFQVILPVHRHPEG